MQCYIVSIMLTRDSFFNMFTQLCYCLFWDQLFVSSSSFSPFVFCSSYYVSPSLLSKFSAPYYQPRTNPPSICSSWHIIHVISNYLWARLIPSAGWAWEPSSIALYKSQSTSVWISLYLRVTIRFASSRRNFKNQVNLQVNTLFIKQAIRVIVQPSVW